MPTLQERFSDLAEEAPRSPTPPGIWDEGRRRARAVRMGSATVLGATLVLVVLGVGLAGLAGHSGAIPGYAARPGSAAALPTVIHEPSEWLGTDSAPPGPLSMVIPTKKRSLTGYRWGLVGVSATTGRYGFLDLPGFVTEGTLSPDGRRYAYWFGSGPTHGKVVQGLAVYDTTTGHLDRWRPRADERLDPNGLAWNGDDALTFVRTSQDGGRSLGYLWQPGQGDPQPLAENLSRLVGSAGQAGLYSRNREADHLFYLDAAAGRGLRSFSIGPTPGSLGGGMSVSPSGRLLAAVHLSFAHSSLLVGRIASPGTPVRLHTLPTTLHWPTPVGWADERHLVVVDQVSPTTHQGSGDANATYALARVDVDTGQVTTLAPMGSMGGTWVDFAGGVLGSPTRDFAAPTRPWDQRDVALFAVVVICAGMTAFVWWRRRVRT